MTQKRSPLPGSMPGATSARSASCGQVGPAPMRAGLLSLLLRQMAPTGTLGLVAAASVVVAETWYWTARAGRPQKVPCHVPLQSTHGAVLAEGR